MPQTKPRSKGPHSTCPTCNRMFDQNSKRTRVYCSRACKQKAFRASQTTPMEAAIRKTEAIQKRISTKSQTKTEFACAFCGKTWVKSGLEANRIYCDDSCKMKAYRAKRKAEKADQLARQEQLNIRGANGLASYFYKMNRDFKECYGYPMITDGSVLHWDNNGYYARKGEQTIAYFANIGICVKWLQDYYAKKRPNMAMLRKR